MLLVSTGAQTLYTGPLTGRLGGADEERAPAAGGPEERVAVH